MRLREGALVMPGQRDDDAFARAARLAFAEPADDAIEDEVGELALRGFGDYELLEVLGAGGMGVVYRARHRVLEREVALKIIAEDARNDDSGALFLDEARNAARLNHPNIVPVHDVGTRGGLHYFSMQLVDGEHLGRRIARGVLGEREAIALLLPVCDALDYAHRLGVLHLDLKPANILLDSRGSPLVADFGLARRVGADGTARARDVSGTPAYMAPEQLNAETGRLTVATDVYSLGAVLYEMLAGISPHGRGDAAELAARALSGTIAPLARHRADVSKDLAAVCRHCLAHEPAQRYASVAALADDLRRVRDALPVSVRRQRVSERARAWVRREPRFAGALALALVAMFVGAIATGAMWLRTERARERAELSAELGARLFVQGSGEYDDRSARELIAWLQERLPCDSENQTAILADYSDALVRANAGIRRYTLRGAILEVFGDRYRRDMVAALQARGDARSLRYAATLAWMIGEGSKPDAGFESLIASALDAAPESRETLFVAATFCDGGDDSLPMSCPVPDAARRLVALDHENAFAWAALLAQVPQAEVPFVLHEAAARSKVDDYCCANHADFAEAMASVGLEVPPQLAVLYPGVQDVRLAVADEEAWIMPDTLVHRVGWICDPARNDSIDAAMRADCMKLALALNAANASIGTTMMGSAMIRRLAPGTPLAQRMIDERRVMIYRRETLARSTPDESRHHTTREEDLRTMGEEGGLRWMAEELQRRGLPADPPADWQPNDPRMMELPENRPRRG